MLSEINLICDRFVKDYKKGDELAFDRLKSSIQQYYEYLCGLITELKEENNELQNQLDHGGSVFIGDLEEQLDNYRRVINELDDLLDESSKKLEETFLNKSKEIINSI